MAEIPDVTDASFRHEVLESRLPVLVDFWGDHCPACRQISPILRELAEERVGSLKVVKVHAAENSTTSAKYGVRDTLLTSPESPKSCEPPSEHGDAAPTEAGNQDLGLAGLPDGGGTHHHMTTS